MENSRASNPTSAPIGQIAALRRGKMFSTVAKLFPLRRLERKETANVIARMAVQKLGRRDAVREKSLPL